MKYTLGVIAGDDCDKKSSDEEPSEDDDPKNWSGKNVFQLLSANIVDLLDKKMINSKDGTPDNAPDSTPEETTQEDCNRSVRDQENQTPTTTQSGTPDGTPEEDCDSKQDDENNQPEVIVQHCILEQDLAAFNRTLSKQLKLVNGDDDHHEDKKEKATLTICDTIDNSRELEMGVERSESSCSVRLEDGNPEAEDENPKAADGNPEVDEPPVEKKGPSEEEGEPSTSGVPDSQNAALPETQNGPGTPETSLACLMREETTQLTLPQPLLVILCYALAVAHQFSGLDFLSALGILCAALSMVSMWFL